MSNISARVIADSINNDGNRLTSLVIVLPRIVLAEFNTHRAISKNSASSRAIPFKKMAKMIEENPFIPIAFQKDHKGMQGTEYFTEEEIKKNGIIEEWLGARDYALHRATALHEKGVTKQLVNRLLEPFMYHTIIATATEWENFIALRAHNQAEIHIQDAAFKILEALNNSKPRLLQPGEWHIPFGDNIDKEQVRLILEKEMNMLVYEDDVDKALIEIAIARCARVSYMNFEGKDDYMSDFKLYKILKDSGHMSPFEHVAQALDSELPSGNLIGFRQYRKVCENENKNDNRLLNYKNL